jgi:hypothetical protein
MSTPYESLTPIPHLASHVHPVIQPNRVRIAALFHPAPHISNEEFRRYWLEEHGKIFMSLDIAKTNLTKYEQVRVILDVILPLIEPSCAVSL